MVAKLQYTDTDTWGKCSFERPKKLCSVYDQDMAKEKTAGKPGRRTSVETAERYREMALTLMRERYDNKQERLADALGMSQGSVSTLVSGKGGVGVAMIEALDRLYASSSLPAAARRALEEPYPCRRIVLELAEGEGVSKSVLRALCAVVPPTAGDPGEDYWQEKLLDIETRRKGIAGRLGK
jgi:predicted transcriptional regulator